MLSFIMIVNVNTLLQYGFLDKYSMVKNIKISIINFLLSKHGIACNHD